MAQKFKNSEQNIKKTKNFKIRIETKKVGVFLFENCQTHGPNAATI